MGAVRGVAQRVAARWTGNSGASTRDMAVPLGCNQPPPEVLFQRGAQNRWMPDPDALQLPEANDLYPVVCNFMRKLNVQASPGFYCIAAPFIKYAEKEVPAVNGRGVEKTNVLAPYFARFFALMMEKAQIPEMWKAAKVRPLQKRGQPHRPAAEICLASWGREAKPPHYHPPLAPGPLPPHPLSQNPRGRADDRQPPNGSYCS